MSRRIGLHTVPSIVWGTCKINIEVYKDGETTTEHKVVINEVEYAHNDIVVLPIGKYSLTWQAENTAYFYMWVFTGNLSVKDVYAASTILSLECGTGTLTLKLTSLPAFGYDIRSGGTVPIEVRDPYGTSPLGDLNGGSYDNR